MKTKELPTVVYYTVPNGIAAYEDNTPNGYDGEVKVVFRPYALKNLSIKDSDKIESSFKNLKDRKSWETLLQTIENKVTLGIKNTGVIIDKISWGTDSRTGKDIMRIKGSDSNNYSYVAELLYQVLEVKSLTNNNDK